jgi:hypothetical protein
MLYNHTFSRMLLAGSLVLPGVQFAIGQQPRQAAGQPAQAGARQGNDPSGRSDANGRMNGQNPAAQILRGSQIIGATVNLRGGSRFGAISDFVLGEGGCVDYVVASYQGQYVPIPWGAAMYQPGSRILLVDIDAARIHEMPMFRTFAELSNRQFSDRVHTFYRGTNGQQGANGQQGDTNQRGAANEQGARPNAQPANPAPSRAAAGQVQGNRAGRTERTSEKR